MIETTLNKEAAETQMIETTLNKAAASELFERNALYCLGYDLVPESRAASLFGDAVLRYFKNHIGDMFKKDREYTLLETRDRGTMTLFTEVGFMELVSAHNYVRIISDKEFKQATSREAMIDPEADPKEKLRARWNLA